MKLKNKSIFSKGNSLSALKVNSAVFFTLFFVGLCSAQEPRPRLILFSGMGGDERLFGPIKIEGAELFTPKHVDTEKKEELPAYAARLAQIHAITERDVVGGTSFGGMIAAEIASQQKVAGLVLLGTCLKPKCLPRSYRILEKIGPLIPTFMLGIRSWKPILRMRFKPLTPEAEATLVEMAKDYPPKLIRSFARMALKWEGRTVPPVPTLAVHGDQDWILPLKCAEPGLVLKNAGHAFTLTHGPETSVAIEEFLKGLTPS